MTFSRLAIALAITLAAALIVAQFSPPEDLGRNIAGLIGFAMCAVLVGPSVLGNYQLGEAVRAALIWGVILALVAVAYTMKSSFGF